MQRAVAQRDRELVITHVNENMSEPEGARAIEVPPRAENELEWRSHNPV